MGLYKPGEIRLGEDDQIRLSQGPKPSFAEFLARVDNVNQHGKLAPMEFVAVTQEGEAVFSQPYVAGRSVRGTDADPALEKLGLRMLTDIGGVAAIGKVGEKYVLFDDLHGANVKQLPGGRVDIIDAINRDLDEQEVEDLRSLGRLPDQPKVSRDHQNLMRLPSFLIPLPPPRRLSRRRDSTVGPRKSSTARCRTLLLLNRSRRSFGTLPGGD